MNTNSMETKTETMQISVLLHNVRRTTIDCSSTDTIKNIALKIYDTELIHPDHQMFFLDETLLENDMTLLDCKVQNDSMLTMMICGSDNIAAPSTIMMAGIYDEPVDYNAQDEYGLTSLMWACKFNRVARVKSLLAQQNIDVNVQDKKDNTAAIYASMYNFIDCVKLLGTNKNINFNIVNKKKLKVINYANINMLGTTLTLNEFYNTPLDDYYDKKQNNMPVNCNAQDKYGLTALMWACKYGSTANVQLLLDDENIDVNIQDRKGNTALIIASMMGFSDCAQLLMEKDCIQINIQNIKGNTALHYAAGEVVTDEL